MSRRASIVLPAPGEPTNSRCGRPPLRSPALAAPGPDRARPPCRRRGSLGAVEGRAAASGSDYHVPRRNPTTSSQRLGPDHAEAVHLCRLGGVGRGDDEACRPRGARRRSRPTARRASRRSSPFSDSSPTKATPRTAAGGTCAVAASTATPIGRSSPARPLPQVRGGEVHDDATQRPLEPRMLHSGTDPFPSVLDRGARDPVRVSDGSPRPTKASTVTG